MMRIITGRAKGIKLETLAGDNTRPTAERAKEAVFSAIQFDIEGREVLDLYAGSGQMGLEAVSRGAVSATLVDKSKDAVAVINKNVAKTKLSDSCRVFCMDAFDYIKTVKGRRKFDIIFIDPPYALKAVPQALSALLDADLLKCGSIIVCESEEQDVFESAPTLRDRFSVVKSAKYGFANITILTPCKEDAQ